ncbi:protein tipE-like isoform X2 [Oratosquilla oratoria]|uniref:protein tipE-like isoform X2 n=1 Tax=Oratosquilla oratoria TaxID=337810 RepID=UPI003F761B86
MAEEEEQAAKAPPPEPEEPEPTFLDTLRFYLTAFFTLLACFSSFAFLFLVPFVIDPAFATILANFNPEPMTCVTSNTEYYFGQSKCKWSSCREGCTKDVFQCMHVYVNYLKDDSGVFKGTNFTNPDDMDKYDWTMANATLYPNVKGCGYPPDVNCSIFNRTYAVIGSTYPCYFSESKPYIVLTELNLDQTTMDLVYAIILPWGCFLVSMLYLFLTFLGMRKPDMPADVPQEISSAKASKEASNYSLRSIGKTINQGMTKLRGDQDDKGSAGGGGRVGSERGGEGGGSRRGKVCDKRGSAGETGGGAGGGGGGEGVEEGGGGGGGCGVGGGGRGRGGYTSTSSASAKSPSQSSPHVLLVPSSLPHIHPTTRRATLPPLDRTPPLPRPASSVTEPADAAFHDGHFIEKEIT